jgi:nitroreductase
VNVEDAIRTRRTIKAFDPAPVPPATLGELFELARWAPNHHVTNPWRFRVLGPAALRALKAAERPDAAAKLDRAPTLVAASAVVTGDPVQDEEDVAAGCCAIYNVLLGAHARGLAAYWRTPGVLRTPAGRAAAGIADGERVLGLIYLGRPRQSQRPPDRAEPATFVTYLD